MIAGGIGVVPFRVFMKYALDTKSPLSFTLFYANPTQERITYAQEFDYWNQSEPTITIVNTLTQSTPSDWNGETGRITVDMIHQHVHSSEKQRYYVCGPVHMVEDTEQMLLNEMNIDASQVHTEKFTGY